MRVGDFGLENPPCRATIADHLHHGARGADSKSGAAASLQWLERQFYLGTLSGFEKCRLRDLSHGERVGTRHSRGKVSEGAAG